MGKHGRRAGGGGCGHWRGASLPLLLPSMELPAGVGGCMWEGGGSVPSDGSGLSRPQDPPVPRSILRCPILLAAVVLLPPLRHWPVPQLQVSLSRSLSLSCTHFYLLIILWKIVSKKYIVHAFMKDCCATLVSWDLSQHLLDQNIWNCAKWARPL